MGHSCLRSAALLTGRISYHFTAFRRFVATVVFAITALGLIVLIPGKAKEPNTNGVTAGPVLLSQGSSTRAVAVDSVIELREPFALTAPVSFASDNRTRVMLFATNLGLNAGEGAAAVTADAEDG